MEERRGAGQRRLAREFSRLAPLDQASRISEARSVRRRESFFFSFFLPLSLATSRRDGVCVRACVCARDVSTRDVRRNRARSFCNPYCRSYDYGVDMSASFADHATDVGVCGSFLFFFHLFFLRVCLNGHTCGGHSRVMCVCVCRKLVFATLSLFAIRSVTEMRAIEMYELFVNLHIDNKPMFT